MFEKKKIKRKNGNNERWFEGKVIESFGLLGIGEFKFVVGVIINSGFFLLFEVFGF